MPRKQAKRPALQKTLAFVTPSVIFGRMNHPIADFLKASGLSREDLAARAGISRMTLWRIMTRKGEHSTATLRAVSDATGSAVTLAQLVEPTNEGAQADATS